MRVLLVTAPFATTERPALNLSLLAALLRSDAVACDIAYLNVKFAASLGREAYERIASGLPDAVLAGEWVFKRALFGEERFSPLEPAATLRVRWGLERDDIALLLDACERTTGFIDEWSEWVAEGHYGVVGFTSSCQQNNAALAIARRVKELAPETVIAFGGPNWHGAMGEAYHSHFDFVDAAFVGEADLSFPLAVRLLAAGGKPDDLVNVPGIVIRSDDSARETVRCAAPVDLDQLPNPDFGDYFDALKSVGWLDEAKPTLSVETSRGCWWANPTPCLFCGQTRPSLRYRSKSPGRIEAELRALTERWPCVAVDIVDNVVSGRFVRQVLPAIRTSPLPAPLFFEVRTSLTRDELALVAACEARIQAGVESLNDHILKLMGKGTRALEGIRFLKWCSQEGVNVAWNFMYGLPGETDEDYAQLIELLPAIRFLPAPAEISPLAIDRFSPFFDEPERYCLRGIEPRPSYAEVFALPERTLRGIAYSHDHEDDAGLLRRAQVYRLLREIRRWQEGHGQEDLRLARDGGRWFVHDTRKLAAHKIFEPDDLELGVLTASEDIATSRELRQVVTQVNGSWSPARFDAALNQLLARRLIVSDGERFLSLPLSGVSSPLPD